MEDFSTLYCPLTPADQLCYIHIPKTAGSTLTAIADAQFDVRQIAPAPRHLPAVTPAAQGCNPDQLKALLTQYRFIRGHFSHNDIRQLLTRPVYLTVLRDPVDRVISVYEFFRRAAQRGQPPETPEYAMLMKAAAEQDLLGFVLDPNPVVQLRTSSFQTRQLATWDGDWSAVSAGDRLRSACASVDQFAWVGLTEQFQASAQLLSYRFGWYPAAVYQNLRVVTHKPRRDGVAPDVIEAIAQHNALDVALYQHAKTRFETQYQQMLNALRRQENLQDPDDPAALQAALQQHYVRHYAAPPLWGEIEGDAISQASLNRLLYDFRQPLSGEGWHRRNGRFNGIEVDQPVVRWSGPGLVSILDLPLPAGLAAQPTLRITVAIEQAIAPAVLDSLQLSVNQQPIPLKVLTRPPTPQPHAVTLQGPLPAIANSQPFIRLSFRVSQTLPRNLHNPALEDSRPVGFALQQITIEPARRRWW
ncbi:MAG: hypothetical protein D6742_02145, partial [Cyanobacteria bacterium J069]